MHKPPCFATIEQECRNAERKPETYERSAAQRIHPEPAQRGRDPGQCQCPGGTAGGIPSDRGGVALLRAGGAQIDATPRGYQLHPAQKGYVGILACVHSTEEEMRTELYTIVDQGGIVVDVAVENSLYGELRGNLNLASRYDVDNFIQQAKNTPESLLSRMTGGVHLHTLHCPDADSFERIRQALDEKGILYRKE